MQEQNNTPEDSENITSDEASEALVTQNIQELTQKVLRKNTGGPVRYELLRKDGHLYCRVSFKHDKHLYKIDWICDG